MAWELEFHEYFANIRENGLRKFSVATLRRKAVDPERGKGGKGAIATE